ncbi:DUF2147 domain-containing protein [Flavihumibacter cheonanensis]|uniref:hypothetical protein n=1 Tax=Flavihumibacter cheonanensis TaxID=1442385 RepID=UPI001EF81642|nr:hypothetical protein [Flavihumibacter cheonanensis]MCG7753674.1 hypothetical protein [Flavihumibacter cheonanensis]
MKNSSGISRRPFLFCSLMALLFLSISFSVNAQTITGVWRGKIKGQQAEVKIVKSGDELVGVAYYYQKKNKYKRYSLRGHFDPNTNSVIWWDEMLLDDYGTGGIMQLRPDAGAQMMVADFNCPGGEEMYLDGTSSSRDKQNSKNGEVHLQKMSKPIFNDEWDFIIDNYFVGGNDPILIDSVSQITAKVNFPEEKNMKPVMVIVAPGKSNPPPAVSAPEPGAANPTPAPVEATAAPAPVASAPIDVVEKKFTTRKNVLQTVIPITAKTIELRFYDNAQVDGDSIALFLNGRLLFKNIRLTEEAYTIKINAADLQADNELVMVAENLGSIPPNTSFMVAIVGDKRYEARLFANEQSSAMIRLVNPELLKE